MRMTKLEAAVLLICLAVLGATTAPPVTWAQGRGDEKDAVQIGVVTVQVRGTLDPTHVALLAGVGSADASNDGDRTDLAERVCEICRGLGCLDATATWSEA